MRLPLPIIASALALACAGCSREQPAPPATVPLAAGGTITINELDQLTYAYADRYFMTVGSAADQLRQGDPDPGRRRIAQRIKLNGVLAMNDIASSPDPYAQVLDLVVAVSLQSRLAIDEGMAAKAFGARAPILEQAAIQVRREVWELAAKVLTPDQLERLDYLIDRWRRAHPEQQQVAFVKFDDFAADKSADLLGELRDGGGLLAPVREVTHELNQYRRLAERAFWYAKRAPSVAGIQAEAATGEILAAPEIARMIDSVERVTHNVDRLSGHVDEVAAVLRAEGPALAAGTRDMLGSATALAAEVRQAITAADQLIRTARSAAEPLLPLLAPTPGAPPGRPFDIREYTAVLAAGRDCLAEVNLLAGQSATAAALATQQMQAASAAADGRIDRVFHLLWATIAGVALLLLAGLLLWRRLPPRGMP
jgi:hypothetical protein